MSSPFVFSRFAALNPLRPFASSSNSLLHAGRGPISHSGPRALHILTSSRRLPRQTPSRRQSASRLICHQQISTGSRRSASTLPTTLALPSYEVIDNRTVFSWKDTETDATGWIVIDNPFPTVAGGGCFMHSLATLKEVTDVACAMSYKLTVTSQPQVVGAKGGVRYDHRAPDAQAVLERFVRDNAAVISTYWGTGGDLNTSHGDLDKYIKKHAGLECALAPIAAGLRSTATIPEILKALQTRVPMHGGQATLEDASVGYGAAISLRRLIMTSAPHRMGDVRVVLQGLGTVGATFSNYINQLGIGRVVGISSEKGYIVDEDGIDVDAICTRRQAASTTNPAANKSLEAGLTSEQLTGSSYTTRLPGSSDQEHLTEFVSNVRADVFAPCAGRYVIDPSVLEALATSTFEGVPFGERFIVAGANNTLSLDRDETTWLEHLDETGIVLMPEWISNSGTASVFMRSCAGMFTPERPETLLYSCGQDIEVFLSRVCELHPAPLTSSIVFESCYDVARQMRRRGATNRLGVERIVLVDCITTKAKRAYETFTQVMGGVPIQTADGFTHLRLPGADDPMLRITPAPENASHSETGLHVFFGVTNLAKTCSILQEGGLNYELAHSQELGQIVHLNGEQCGYPMSFVQATGPFVIENKSESQPMVLEDVGVKQLDHYTLIVPDADAVMKFHEEFMGYTHLRTIKLNAGSGVNGEDDMLNHVLALPNDNQRVLVVTEGLKRESVFSRLLERKRRPYVHHMAMQVSDVTRAFERARAVGWKTTSDAISQDMLSGLRQFFIREEEVGCFVELIERATGRRKAGMQEEVEPTKTSQGDFKKGNMASLAQSMESYVANSQLSQAQISA